MMATTHALAGMALASVSVLIAPEHAPAAVSGAAVGELFPDLDLYGDHRRALHYPILYSLAALVVVPLAVLVSTAGLLALAAFVTAAALHSVMDAFGGGLELKPWQETSDRAVYSHYHGRWIPPRRWVRYDGAPEDVGVAAVLALPVLAQYDGTIQTVALALLGISVCYGLIRKPLVAVTVLLVDSLPTDFVDRLPARFTEDR